MPPSPQHERSAGAPGELIREELQKRSWSQEDLAQMLGRTTARVSQIITGKQELSPEIALALESIFGIPATDWLQREAAYRLSLAKADTADVSRRARLFGLAPVREMQKRGWIKATDSPTDLESELARFFAVPDLTTEPPLSAAMRKTHPHVELTPAQKAWVFRVRQLAAAHATPPYDPDKVDACKKELRKLAAYSAEVRKVPQVLAKFGIRFVVVEPLAGGKVDGVATWLNENTPVIGMAIRFDRLDSFWFTLGHELSHIKHRDDVPLDGDVSNQEDLHLEVKSPIERRADEESAATFIDPDELKSFIGRVGPLYSKERINQFANRIKMHPGIIVGQLQHRGEIGYSANKEMLVKVRHHITPVAITDGWGHTIDPRVFE